MDKLMGLDWPLMKNNITREDIEVLIDFLRGVPRLTQSENVSAFEREWSEWLNVKHSVFVNSGASANLITMAAVKHLCGGGEVVVPTLTWVSDIASVLQNGLTPVFVDIDARTLCMDEGLLLRRLNEKTRAVFLTHVQGFNGLTDRILAALKERGIPLIEDVCEAHGATFKGRKLGSFGYMSNFSFYFAHHMSTVEGGMVCTNDDKVYDTLRMLRSHGMVREAASPALRDRFAERHPDLTPDFIFAFPAFNVRSSEMNAVLGRHQLKHLDANNAVRRRNLDIFLQHLDPVTYWTDFEVEGSCNYAFPLVIRKADPAFRDRVELSLSRAGVEFRRGSSGGGNQLRQPYLKALMPDGEFKKHPVIEHVHFYGYYIGNYPGLEKEKILQLCRLLNALA
jgi:CDP-6-deoxy-D-xylo-4-hexulose-3-dehydrase